MNCQPAIIQTGDGQRWCSVAFRKDVTEKWVLSPLVEQEEETLPLRKWGRVQKVSTGQVIISWVARRQPFRKTTRHLLVNPSAEVLDGNLVPGCVEVMRNSPEYVLYQGILRDNPWLPGWLAEVHSSYLPSSAIRDALAYQVAESGVQAAIFCTDRGLGWVVDAMPESDLPWTVECRSDHLQQIGPRAKLYGWAGRGRPVLLSSDRSTWKGWKEVIEVDFSRRRLIAWKGESPWTYPGKSFTEAAELLKKSGAISGVIYATP